MIYNVSLNIELELSWSFQWLWPAGPSWHQNQQQEGTNLDERSHHWLSPGGWWELWSSPCPLLQPGLRRLRGAGHLAPAGAVRHGAAVHPRPAHRHDLPQPDPLALHPPGAQRAADRAQQQPDQLRPRPFWPRPLRRGRRCVLHGQTQRRREPGGGRQQHAGRPAAPDPPPYQRCRFSARILQFHRFNWRRHFYSDTQGRKTVRLEGKTSVSVWAMIYHVHVSPNCQRFRDSVSISLSMFHWKQITKQIKNQRITTKEREKRR